MSIELGKDPLPGIQARIMMVLLLSVCLLEVKEPHYHTGRDDGRTDKIWKEVWTRGPDGVGNE